jgi:hypothetical protein
MNLIDVLKLIQDLGPTASSTILILVAVSQYSSFRLRYELEERDRHLEDKLDRLITALSTEGTYRSKLRPKTIRDFELLDKLF